MDNEFLVHKAVFGDQVQLLDSLLSHDDGLVVQKDKHGNTPLHLAVMMGHSECIDLLLKYNAPIKVKNMLGWSILAEAVSYGDRDTIRKLLETRHTQMFELETENQEKIVKTMEKVPDFEIDIHWDFRTWVPLASQLLPSDTCHIAKYGNKLRLDSTLLDFNNMKWERGNNSYIFDCSANSSQCMLIIDHTNQLYAYTQVNEIVNIDDELNFLMSTQISQMTVSTSQAVVSRAQTGWFIKEDRSELIADQFNCDIYTVDGIEVHWKKRTEHLSTEDIRKSKEIIETFLQTSKNGNGNGNGNRNGNDAFLNVEQRSSLNKPPKPNVTWSEYISAAPGKYPCLGRPIICKTKNKRLKLTVAMSNEFPLSIETLVQLLEMVAPLKRFKKLRDFVKLKLPNTDGFPVRLEVPVLPTVTAQVTFQQFKWTDFNNGHEAERAKFDIPDNYAEDTTGCLGGLTG